MTQDNDIVSVWGEIQKRLNGMGWTQMSVICKKAMSNVQKELKEKIVHNFNALPIKKSEHWFPRKNLGTSHIYEDIANGSLTATTSILRGNGAYKWFEKGTQQRHTYSKTNPRNTGKIKAYHFFKNAVEQQRLEESFLRELDKLIKDTSEN